MKWMAATLAALAIPSTLAWAAFLSAMPEISLGMGVVGGLGAGACYWYGLKQQREHAAYIIGEAGPASVQGEGAGDKPPLGWGSADVRRVGCSPQSA
jgi:hypothetical protein